MDEERPITDKENFPSKSHVFSASQLAYEDGYNDGYRSCLVLIFSMMLMLFIVERLTR